MKIKFIRRVLFMALFSSWGQLHAQLWQPVGNGASAEVLCIHPDTAAHLLYAGGIFEYVDQLQAKGVAVWDGNQWSGLVNGADSSCSSQSCRPVCAIADFDTSVFIGGAFSNASGVPNTKYLARFDGNQWVSEGVPDGQVINFAVINSELYALGFYVLIDGVPNYGLAKWNGSGWDQLNNNGGPGGQVRCAIFFQGELIVGGNFSLPDGNNIAKWDGNDWVSFNGGTLSVFNTIVTNLVEYNGELYASGVFSQLGAPDDLMKWDGQNWVALSSNLHFPGPTLGVKDLEVIDGYLYAVGSFRFGNSSTTYGMLRYDGAQICAFGGPDIYGNDIAGLDGELYLATNYEVFNGDTVNYLAHWIGGSLTDTCVTEFVAVDEHRHDQFTFELFPNPATEQLTIELSGDQNAFITIKIFDLCGRLVLLEDKPSPQKHAVDLRSLAPGTFLVQVQTAQGTKTELFVKQ
jgi:hypothetical protein